MSLALVRLSAQEMVCRLLWVVTETSWAVK
jgi:hypothetical protein